MGDSISFPKWEVGEARPALLHIRSVADLELFGINGSNYGALVLEQAAWSGGMVWQSPPSPAAS